MNTTLKEVAQIRFGYYSQETTDNGIPYLQARQFDDGGNLINLPDSFLALDSKSNVHLLKDGEVILVGKGSKNFAWCYRSEFGQAIASTIFFVITPDQRKINPEFLTAIFNLRKSQSYFKQLSAGSNIPSIRKEDLANFQLPFLPLVLQEKIVSINKLHQKDLNLTLQLLQKKSDLYEEIINKLITN